MQICGHSYFFMGYITPQSDGTLWTLPLKLTLICDQNILKTTYYLLKLFWIVLPHAGSSLWHVVSQTAWVWWLNHGDRRISSLHILHVHLLRYLWLNGPTAWRFITFHIKHCQKKSITMFWIKRKKSNHFSVPNNNGTQQVLPAMT